MTSCHGPGGHMLSSFPQRCRQGQVTLWQLWTRILCGHQMASHCSLWLLGFLSLKAFALLSCVSSLPFGGSLLTPLPLTALVD